MDVFAGGSCYRVLMVAGLVETDGDGGDGQMSSDPGGPGVWHEHSLIV